MRSFFQVECGMKRKRHFFSWGHILIVAVIVYLFILAVQYGMFQEGCNRWDVEIKANLHTIQIAVERYNVEKGNYPPFLLGGDKEGWEYYNSHRPDGAPYLCDPLIESEMLVSYPEHALEGHSTRGSKAKKDRNAYIGFKKQIRRLEGGDFDPRFGLNGDTMGNVLMEPYIFVEQRDKKLEGYPRMCPGQFYYKAFGEVSTYEGYDLSEIRTPDDYEYQEHVYYVLGAFGSVTEPGKDTIRWADMAGDIPRDFPYQCTNDNYRTPEGLDITVNLQLPEAIGSGNSVKVPMWPPRGYLNIGEKLFGVPEADYILSGWKYKCPDGMPDGVILILTTGPERNKAGL